MAMPQSIPQMLANAPKIARKPAFIWRGYQKIYKSKTWQLHQIARFWRISSNHLLRYWRWTIICNAIYLSTIRTAYNCRQQGQLAVCCAPQTTEVYLAPLDYIWIASS